MEIFKRRDILLNENQIEKLKSAKIALFGLGGVGGLVFDQLLRMGITNFILVDGDTFDETNLNRQILSNRFNIGKLKTEVAYDYAKTINDDISISIYSKFINKDNINELNLNGYYIVDCIDDANAKVELVKLSEKNNLKIISMMGAGNRLNANFIVSDIYKTEQDPLSKKMRQLLKNESIKKLKVVYTKDPYIKHESNEIGSISYVVSSASLKMVEEVIKDIIS